MMTEREYVLAGDIRTLRHVQELLQGIVPANNPALPEEKFRQARAALAECLDALWAVTRLQESK